MNVLVGKISHVQTEGSLSLVGVRVGESLFRVLLIDSPETAPYLKTDTAVEVIFKETEVVLSWGGKGEVSIQNRLQAGVISVAKGPLLSRIRLSTEVGEVVAVVLSELLEEKPLQEGEQVTALIKSNEVMLAPLSQ